MTHGVLSLDVGGLERIVLALIRAGRQRGCAVSVVCVEQPGGLAAEAEAAGAKVIALGKPPGRRSEFSELAADALRGLRPDVVHTHQIGAAWYHGRAARRLGIPVVHTEHGNHVRLASGLRQAVRARLFLHSAARYIDHFCCVSAEIASAVTRWWTVPRVKVDVVPNGIPVERASDLPPPESVRASLGIPPAAPVIGTVGRLTEVKRQDVLLRAMRRVHERFPDAHLLLVGDGPEREPLEGLGRELGLGGRVHFLGYQPCPEQYLMVMNAFVLTSRSEGFPVSLLEAWRESVPVVCTAVGGVPAVVSHGMNGLLAPAGDVAAVASALVRLIDDRAYGLALGQAGRSALRQRYSLDRMADEYEVRYRRVLAARSGGG